MRSRFGSMMVHEIHPDSMSHVEVEMFKKFLAFGYGLEDCKVHRYWEDEFPLRVSDDRVKVLMLERGDKRLLLACSWNAEPMSVRVDLSGAKLPGGGAGCKATNVDDPTVDPRFGKVGKQTIKDTGPLTKKRMET